MSNEKISIIIPVYNVEKYLKQCLDSLVEQTYRNLEIICIDDESPDASRLILEEYEQKDERIKIISKKNGGLGAARNTGLDVASGDFISFVDSDDWCEVTMFEQLYNIIKQTGADFSICATFLFDDIKKQTVESSCYFSLKAWNGEFEEKYLDITYLRDQRFGFNVPIWNKLFRRDYLIHNNLRFKEGLLYEDQLFFIDVFRKTTSFAFTKKKLYHYRINRKGSIMQNSEKGISDYIFFIEYLYSQNMKERHITIGEKRKLWQYIFNCFDQFFPLLGENGKEKFYQKAREFVLTHKISKDVLQTSFVLQEKNKAYFNCKNYVFFARNCRRFVKKKIKETSVKYYILGVCILCKKLDGKKYLFNILPLSSK